MGGSMRIAGGIVQLVDALVAGLPEDRIHLGSCVEAVDREDGVRLADGQTWQAQQLVLALPPRVAALLTFSPVLTPEQMRCLERIPTWMAGHAKFVAVYETPFWRASGLSGDAMSRRGPLAEIHDASGRDGAPAALFGFLGLPPVIRAQHAGEIKTAALEQLARIFGEDAVAPTATALQDWAFEPKTATERDFVLPATHPDYGLPSALAALWDGRLHFGSTEMAPQLGGYMEGALAVAENVAMGMGLSRHRPL
jgi:monoamine oxidase